jgi:CHAT domain-containing protein
MSSNLLQLVSSRDKLSVSLDSQTLSSFSRPWMQRLGVVSSPPFKKTREEGMLSSRPYGTYLILSLLLASLSGVPPSAQRAGAGAQLAFVWQALAGSRPLEARITRGFQEAVTVSKSNVQELSRDISEIELRAANVPSYHTLQDLGLLRLAQGRYMDAILSLEAASAQAARDPKPASDLAASYLARSRAESRAFDLILALDAADRALAIEPQLAEALFNRAEALTRLSLCRQARAAWELLLRQDGRSAWAFHASHHVRELTAPSIAESWRIERPLLEAAALRHDARTVREIVRRFPHLVRLDAEERILPAWGEAQRSGDRAAAAARLAVATEIGAALAEATGDAMILDTTAANIRAREPGLAELAEGLAVFGRGVDLFNRSKIEEARSLLAVAERKLRSGGSPFRGWAEFYGAVCDHYSNPDRAFRAFSRLRRQTDEHRYPVLAGRTTWLLGTIANNEGRPEEALRHYRAAFALLDASAGSQLSSFVHVLLGEAYTALGETEKAWEERVTALAGISRTGEPRRLHAALNETANALLNAGYAMPALAVSDELRANAQAWGKPSALAEAGLDRGWALDLLGRRDEALEQLQEAEDHAAGLDSGLRDRITGPLALAKASALTESNPARGVKILTRALSADLDNGYLFQLTRLLTARARAYRALGDDIRAEGDLRRAIEYHESVRVGVRSEQLRLSTFERAQEVFDEMIRLQVEHHRSPERALEYAERSRSRMLLDLVQGGAADTPKSSGTLPRALAATEILERLPPEVTLIEYAVLPDRLLAWITRHGTLDLVEVNIPEKDVNLSVKALRNALERRAALSESRSAAASLYEVLIRPLEPKLRPVTPLVFVPDRFLVQVPFAALFDARSGRYLIEDRSVSVAPSATLYLTALERYRNLPSGRRTVLAVGDPAFDPQYYPQLPRLAAANAEAAEAAALYPGSQLLRGELATRSAFLEGAENHRLIHFAGHALLHPVPHLSRLLLAPGDSSDSGALYADELAHHPLEHTELVVLSACRTVADGSQRENLTGLAAAFLAAGAPTVVASLWNVDDRPTRELMRQFHLAFRQGSDPGTALRIAQLALLTGTDPNLRSPAAWAGFEVIGGALPIKPD